MLLDAVSLEQHVVTGVTAGMASGFHLQAALDTGRILFRKRFHSSSRYVLEP